MKFKILTLSVITLCASFSMFAMLEEEMEYKAEPMSEDESYYSILYGEEYKKYMSPSELGDPKEIPSKEIKATYSSDSDDSAEDKEAIELLFE